MDGDVRLFAHDFSFSVAVFYNGDAPASMYRRPVALLFLKSDFSERERRRDERMFVGSGPASLIFRFVKTTATLVLITLVSVYWHFH